MGAPVVVCSEQHRFLTADHLIADTETFLSSVSNAVELAQKNKLVTLGVSPRGPETGYGCIESGAAIGNDIDGREVVKFIEKPDVQTAQALIAKGNCFWNAGIFVFKASVFLDTLSGMQPEMHELTRQAVDNATNDLDFLRVGKSAFEQSVNLSVDEVS